MEKESVRQFMVPLDEYATVSEEASLWEALLALEQAQEKFDTNHYRHRAVLVLDKQKQVVGKISQMDAIKALEPKYNQIGGARFELRIPLGGGEPPCRRES